MRTVRTVTTGHSAAQTPWLLITREINMATELADIVRKLFADRETPERRDHDGSADFGNCRAGRCYKDPIIGGKAAVLFHPEDATRRPFPRVLLSRSVSSYTINGLFRLSSSRSRRR